MKVLLYADTQRGAGHWYRCKALEEELNANFHQAGTHTTWKLFVDTCNTWKPDAVVIDTYTPPVKAHILAPVVISVADDIEPLGADYVMLRRQFRELHDYPTPEVESMSKRLVITSGGMSALEAACMGIPILVYGQFLNQRRNIEMLTKGGAAVEIRPPKPGSLREVYIGFSDWFDNDERLADMSQAGKNLIDGRGCERVVKLIEERVGNTNTT